MSNPRTTLLILVTALFGAACSSAEAKAPREFIDPLVQPYLDHEVVVGLTVGVIQNGRAASFGYGRLSDQDARPPDGNTIYEIGSTSKVFTGILLADAVERGRVKLGQAAGDLLPDGVKMPAKGERPITLQDLSTHVSGLPRLATNMKMRNPRNPYADYTVDDLHEFLSNHELGSEPGEQSEYSNLGVGLLGHLLALDAKVSYEQLLNDRIAKPLAMADTTIALTKQQQQQFAPPHTADGQLDSNWDIPTFAGAGAIRSTVDDLLKFVGANLDPPEVEIGAAIELAWKVHQPPLSKENFAMGLGWYVARDGETRWHNGQTGGYHAAIFVNRRINAGVVVLTNTATGEVDALAEQIVQMLAGAKVEPRKFEEPIEVAADVMQRYVGKYQLAPGAVFTITANKGRLYAELTGQPTFQVYPRSDTEWFYKVVEATLTFEVDDDGNCKSVELFQNGARMPAPRIE